MTDCEHPKCHERITTELATKVPWTKFNELRDCVQKKTPKSWLWLGFIVVGLPLLVTGAKVWSETEHGDSKYVTREDMVEHAADIAVCKEAMKQTTKALDEIKAGQKENRRDVKEILRYLRDKP